MTTKPRAPRDRAGGAPGTGRPGIDRATTGAPGELERLRERADRFARLIDDAALGVAVHRDGHLLYVNDACAALLGYASPQAMLTEPALLAHVIEADRLRIAGIVSAGAASAAPGDAPVHCEMNLRHRDGTAIAVQSALRSVGWEGGPAVQVTVTDLTTRDAVEKALRWSEQRFKDFSEAAGDWFWETDAEHRVTYLSRRFEEVTGFVVTRFIGKRRSEAAGADVEQHPWDSHLADLEAKRPFRDFTYSVADTNGRKRYFRINGLPSFDRGGRFRGYRGTGLEVTERIEADERLRTAERRLIEAMEHIPDGYALFDAADRLVHCNRTWREVLNPGIADIMAPGLEFEQAVRENVRRGYIVDAIEAPEAWIAERMSRHREALGTPFEVIRGDGVWNLVREHRTLDGATIVISSDISELKRRELALRESERRFRDYAETAADWFWETDRQHRIVYLSERYEAVTGMSRDEVLGLDPAERESRLSIAPEQIRPVLDHLEAREAFDGIEFEMEVDAGQMRVHALSGRPLYGADGAFVGFRGTGRDVTRARRLTREIAYQASHDSLTGLVNRREFEVRLQRVIESARSADAEHALCYLDLDQFKVINDTCGHLAGDELLRRLSSLLAERVRRRDTLARLGGDEFGVLMEHCTLPQARRVADELRQTVDAFRFHWGERTFAVGVSIGLVAINRGSGDLTEALRAADAACYAAKDQGRNRIHIYDPDDAELARRHGEIQWVTRINDALEGDRLWLACQRIAPIGRTGETRPRYEILLRMRDEDGSAIAPGAFLPAAERFDLASRVDRWVVTRALDTLARHPEHLARLDTCSINLSGQSLGDPDFLAFIAARLDEGTVPADRLCFEITETAAIANVAGAVEFMRALERRGCRFALDDFGIGLSSFGYLKNLPVHYLKIDGSFVRDIARDSVDAAMVRSINDIGHAMGKRTIAEYVEDAGILDRLTAMGVDFAQGYHVARPEPFEATLDR